MHLFHLGIFKKKKRKENKECNSGSKYLFQFSKYISYFHYSLHSSNLQQAIVFPASKKHIIHLSLKSSFSVTSIFSISSQHQHFILQKSVQKEYILKFRSRAFCKNYHI